MAIGFSADIDDEQIRDWLNKLTANIKKVKSGNMPKLIARFGTIIAADVFKHFTTEEGPNGSWEVWSKNYNPGKGRILQQTGRLRNSFKPTNFRKDSEGLLWYNNAMTKAGFPYAYAHDNDEGGREQLPQRKFMWVSNSAMDQLAEATLDVLIES